MAIYINKNNQQSGPLDENVVIEQLRSGMLFPDTPAIRQGGTSWQTLGDIFPGVVSQPATASASIKPALESPKQGGGCLKTALLVLGILFVIGGALIAGASRFYPSPSCVLADADEIEIKQLKSDLDAAKGTPREAVVRRQLDSAISGAEASTRNCAETRTITNSMLILGGGGAFVGLFLTIGGLLLGRRKPG